jgi:hypothetical protein
VRDFEASKAGRFVQVKDKASGLPVHDLRYAGNNLTAEAGANLRELMKRMGHSSTKAALIYLHSTGERQRHLADAVGELARDAMRKTAKPDYRRKRSGTNVARRRTQAS